MDNKIFRYSMISTAYECYRKYKHIYIDKIQIEKESSALLFGTAMHLAIEDLLTGGDGDVVFIAFWSSIRSKELDYHRFSWEDLLELGKLFIARFRKLHAKKFTPFKLEETIEIPFEGYILQGTPDFIGTYEGKPSIFDWKTSTKKYTHWKIKTNEQMYLYAYLAKEKYGFIPEQIGYKVFIKSEERIQTEILPLTDSKLNDMIDNVRLMVRDLANRQTWPRNPNCYCPSPERCFKE